uniref:RING-type domain-containing protein n=1 Tax=viral metagenome TaxID=1070528 RepID=A0A6C0KVI4_9ZZZZ
MQNTNIILQEENTSTLNKSKCSGCRLPGHNIRKCNDNSVFVIRSYYECWFKNITQNKFREIDNMQFDSELWYNILYHPGNFNFKYEIDKLEIPIRHLRIINVNKITTGKNKNHLTHLFISTQLESLVESIENGRFHIQNDYILKIILCLKKYHLSLSNDCDNTDAFVNYHYEMLSMFDDSSQKIKLNCLNRNQEENDDTTFECAICLNTDKVVETGVVTNCNHTFCCECIQSMFLHYENKKNICCAICREDFKVLTLHNEAILHKLANFSFII